VDSVTRTLDDFVNTTVPVPSPLFLVGRLIELSPDVARCL
jgi:hypothetical protein